MVALLTHPKSARVLEPSCGQGVFLRALAEQGFGNVSAYEIDATLRPPFPFVRYESFVSSPMEERFDVIIGNPPYIRWKNLEPELKEELAGSALWQRHFNSLCDYLYLFILKSVEQLTEGGELVFICSDYWLNSTHARSLREVLQTCGAFSDIYRFKETPLFEGVTASLMIFRYVKGATLRSAPITLHTYRDTAAPTLKQLLLGECFSTRTIPQFSDASRWLLADAKESQTIARLESVCQTPSDDLFRSRHVTIGNVCDIGNGMVSGLDKAFKIEHPETLNEQECAALIKVYKAKDLAPLANTSHCHYFFLRERLSAETFKRHYPNVLRQLQRFQGELRKRYNYGRELPLWEFAFPRNERLFSSTRKRILVPCKERISHKSYFRFAFAESDVYPLQDVTCLMPKPSCRESIYYILGFLNTTVVFTWLKHNGITKGDIVEFSEAPLSRIPFRAIDWGNPREVAVHNAIDRIVRDKIASHAGAEALPDLNAAFGELL